MGSGYKNFTAGSVATASDVNNYLMEQSIMYFSSTANRDSAITSPEEGMVVYIGSDNVNEGLYTYNGTSWRKGPGWNAPWGAVGHAVTTTDSAATSGTAAPAVVTWGSMEVTFTAISNRLYRTTASGIITSDNGGGSDYAELIITDGSNGVLASSRAIVQNGVEEGRTVVYVEGNASGSTTRRLRVRKHSGTGNVRGEASAGYQASIVVEDIGPAGVPT